MKNATAKGNDFSTRELGPLSSVPRPVSNPKVTRKSVTRLDGQKTSVLVVDFSRVDASILALNFAPRNPFFYGMDSEIT